MSEPIRLWDLLERSTLLQIDPVTGNLFTWSGHGTQWHEYATLPATPQQPAVAYLREVNVWTADSDGRTDATWDEVRDHMYRVMGERAYDAGFPHVQGQEHDEPRIDDSLPSEYDYGDGPEPFAGANEAARRPHAFVPWAQAPSLCAECALYPEARCHEAVVATNVEPTLF